MSASRFAIAPARFELLPGMRVVVVVALGIDNNPERPSIGDAWREAWRGAADGASVHGNPQSHPRVAPWRERFRAMGVPPRDHPSSIEGLLRRAMKGGEPFRINPLVDVVHSVSLRHVVPAGAFDLGAIRQDLRLRPTREGDRFTALDGDRAEPVPPGVVASISTGFSPGRVVTAVLDRHGPVVTW